MTLNDWVGTLMTVVAFLLMVGLYVYVLRPKNREKYESMRFIPLDDEDRQEIGDIHGRTYSFPGGEQHRAHLG
jgi:cbb3-type cytochrome oxidase subunit 3